MTSFFRRAGQEITRIIALAADPIAETARVLGYGKNVGGVPQFFARSPDFARQVSGTECSIFNKPLVAHALDDEFDSTTLNPAWTIGGVAPSVNAINPYANLGPSYALHTNYRPSWMMVQPSTAGGTRWSKDISSIAGDFFVWMRGSFNARVAAAPVNNDATINIDLTANPWDGNNRVSFNLNESDAGTVQAEFLTVVGGVTTSVGLTRNMFSGQLGAQPIEAVGIQRIELAGVQHYHGWAFSRCGTALWLGSTTYAAATTTLTIGTIDTSAAAPGAMLVGVDFVRFVEGSTFLP